MIGECFLFFLYRRDIEYLFLYNVPTIYMTSNEIATIIDSRLCANIVRTSLVKMIKLEIICTNVLAHF